MEGRVSKISKEMTGKKKDHKRRLEKDPQWEGSEDELQTKSEIAESERTLRSLRVRLAPLSFSLCHLTRG
jgi:hypothetical protein